MVGWGNATEAKAVIHGKFIYILLLDLARFLTYLE